jgi:ubiquinone/menaquinone biosynthesis C-methylase UbiE
MKGLRQRVIPTLLLFLAVLHLATFPALGQEQSVRPGINRPYENPDVREFVGVFEGPDRDIFARRHQIVSACRVRPGMAVADIGAGTGLFTRLFASAVGPAGTVYAVDIAPKFVEHIGETCKVNGLTNVVGVVCPPDSVGLSPGSIDLAFICDTYHHFEFPFRTMSSLHRALRSGGRVVVIDFERIQGVSPPWVLSHVRAGRGTVAHEIISSGFRLVGEVRLLKDKYCLLFEKAKGGQAVTDDAPAAQAPRTRQAAEPVRGGRFGQQLRGTMRALTGVLDSLRAASEGRLLSNNDRPISSPASRMR